MVEIWKSLKDVVEFGDYYEVSNLGRVRSIDKTTSNNRKIKGRILSIKIHSTGYCEVNLKLDKKGKMYKVHRLVALAFIPNPQDKPQVNHKDGNKSNCKLDNLEWVTNSENQKHARDTGLSKERGETHYRARITEDDVINIREAYATGNYKYRELSNMFGLTISNIESIVHRRTWKYL